MHSYFLFDALYRFSLQLPDPMSVLVWWDSWPCNAKAGAVLHRPFFAFIASGLKTWLVSFPCPRESSSALPEIVAWNMQV